MRGLFLVFLFLVIKDLGTLPMSEYHCVQNFMGIGKTIWRVTFQKDFYPQCPRMLISIPALIVCYQALIFWHLTKRMFPEGFHCERVRQCSDSLGEVLSLVTLELCNVG